jgi:hypothetical protein
VDLDIVADDLDSVADKLYGLAPGEFTAARDARAAAARRAGDRALATAIKALRRPSGGAWLANLAVRKSPQHLAQLFDLGAAMRRQAEADVAGDDMRRLSQLRHRKVAAVVDAARQMASQLGQPVSEAMAKELEATLEAAVFDAGAADALRGGRLTKGLRYSGLGPVDLAGALNSPAPLVARPLEGASGAGTAEEPVPEPPQPSELSDLSQLSELSELEPWEEREAPRQHQEEAERDPGQAERERREAERELREAEAAAANSDARSREWERRRGEADEQRARARQKVADQEEWLTELRQAEERAEQDRRQAVKNVEQCEREGVAAHRRLEQARSAFDRFYPRGN